MKEVFFRKLSLFIIIFFLMISFSCSTGQYLQTEVVSNADDVNDVYTLFLYGDGRAVKIAIFDVEGDDYTFELYESQHNYTVGRGVGAEDAVKSAVKFIYTQRSRWNKILDDNGRVIGYDLRPMYYSTRYGTPDILDVTYRIEDKKVIATVDVKLSIKQIYYRNLFGGD